MKTRNVKAYEERKQELLQIAGQLFIHKGYETTTIRDIINAAEIAKGTFYHYFASKEELLDEMVSNRLMMVLPEAQAIIKNTDSNAIDKFNQVFAAIQQWKHMNRELMLTVLTATYRDDNALARFKSSQKLIEVFQPIYQAIIKQGIREGLFSPPSAEYAASIIMALIIGMRDQSWRQLVEALHDEQKMDAYEDLLTAYEQAVARILGAPLHSFVFIDRKLLRTFFDGMQHPASISLQDS